MVVLGFLKYRHTNCCFVRIRLLGHQCPGHAFCDNNHFCGKKREKKTAYQIKHYILNHVTEIYYYYAYGTCSPKQTVNLIPTMDVREKMLQASYLTTLIQSMGTQRRGKISTIPCFQICWCVLIHRCWRPHKVASWSQDPIELEEEHATYLKSNIKLWSPAPQTS